MLKVIGIVALVLVAAIALLLIFASTRPDTFEVKRSTKIKAAPEKIFALVDGLDKWKSWSPYEKLDPNMKRSRSGPTGGKGAVYEWDGNRNAGKGRMEITESTAPSKIVIALDFEKPFEGHNVAEFTFKPNGDSTDVTWAMHGPAAFPVKVIGIFMNMDNMIGKEFENGLANLKAEAEK